MMFYNNTVCTELLDAQDVMAAPPAELRWRAMWHVVVARRSRRDAWLQELLRVGEGGVALPVAVNTCPKALFAATGLNTTSRLAVTTFAGKRMKTWRIVLLAMSDWARPSWRGLP